MLKSKSIIIGAKTIGTIGAVHLSTALTPADAPALLESILQIIVAIGGIIAMFRKSKKDN